MIVVTTVTILWGAMTTSTGSGMAFVDWPLSDGELMPVRSYTELPGFFEHFHRMFGALAGALSLSLVLWLQFGSVGWPEVRRTAWYGLGLITLQGIIGGVGVRLNTPALTSVAHGVVAQLTLAMFAWIAFQLSRHHDGPPAVPGGGGRKLALATVIILVLQTLVGGIARHTNSAHALWTHVGNAFFVFVIAVIATGFAVGRLRAISGLQAVVRWLTSLLILQIVLGFIALLIRNSAGKTPENVANLGTAALISVHVLLGAALTVLAATLCAQVYRGTRIGESVESVGSGEATGG
ncbi:MAG: COX15/CtaA family protein [Planctomycetes bacterium]|nr:COX15/CtaA family protein [Planctomycetota bacterium]